MADDTVLLSTTYLGPVAWYAEILRQENILIDATEPWQKQSFRNRCYIDSAVGPLMLNVPINHSSNKGSISDVKISYSNSWAEKHVQALKSSYGTSPFFEILAPELLKILLSGQQILFELNLQLMKWVLNCLQVDLKITVNQKPTAYDAIQNDFRKKHHPKLPTNHTLPVYPQVFDHKNGFLSNLSVVDLLFNEGPAAYDYLKNL